MGYGTGGFFFNGSGLQATNDGGFEGWLGTSNFNSLLPFFFFVHGA